MREAAAGRPGYRRERDMSEAGDLSDAWSLLVRGGGWPAVVLTLCVCALIPVVGWAFALGYAVEWARDIALGSDEPPRQRGIDAGRCLDEGVRTLAVALGWCAVPAVLLAIDAAVTGEPSFPHFLLAVLAARPDFILLPLLALLVVGPIALLLPILVASPCAVLVAASAVRSAVRRDVAAGRRVCGVTEMVGRDPGGYARVSATVTLLTLACATALVMPTREAGALLVLLVLGAGGTAKAVAYALKSRGMRVCVLNRSEGRLANFAEYENFSWANFAEFKGGKFDLVVNTTSAGLKDENLPAPIEILCPIFDESKFAFDVIYGKKTPFLNLAAASGLANKDGSEMLLFQAVLALNLFYNGSIDEKKIEISMREALSL